MVTLSTTNVKVVRASGAPALKERRALRVVVLPGALIDGMLCVARHNKAIIVTSVYDPETVVVDMKAERIQLTSTRVAMPSDLGRGVRASAAA